MVEKKGKLKGQKKSKPDSENIDENPLLKIDNRVDFSIESSNLLQDPGKLIFPGYENFDLQKPKDHFDMITLFSRVCVIMTNISEEGRDAESSSLQLEED